LQALYEMVPFPNSASEPTLGLLTLHPLGVPVPIAKRIWKVPAGARYIRDGSEVRGLKAGEAIEPNAYEDECRSLLARASVRLEDTLRDFLAFQEKTGASYHPRYMVYRDQHVVCYSGWPQDRFGVPALSEVNVELLTEGVSFFWSALRYVTMSTSPDRFSVCEQALLFWKGQGQLYPFEETWLGFPEDGRYSVDRTFVFRPPKVPQEAVAALVSEYE